MRGKSGGLNSRAGLWPIKARISHFLDEVEQGSHCLRVRYALDFRKTPTRHSTSTVRFHKNEHT